MSVRRKQQKLDDWVIRLVVGYVQAMPLDLVGWWVREELPYYCWVENLLQLNDCSDRILDVNSMLIRIGRAMASINPLVLDELEDKPDVLDDREAMIAIGAVAYSRLINCISPCLEQMGFKWMEQ